VKDKKYSEKWRNIEKISKNKTSEFVSRKNKTQITTEILNLWHPILVRKVDDGTIY